MRQNLKKNETFPVGTELFFVCYNNYAKENESVICPQQLMAKQFTVGNRKSVPLPVST